MDDATQYGVTVQRATPNAAGYVWRALLVKHLEPHENGDNHHLYCDVYGEDGRELRGSTAVRIAWDWDGRRGDEQAKPAPLEKRPPEHMANVPLDKGQIVHAWVDGYGYPSDVVMNVDTDHPDEGDGNSRYHHSFFVAWQLVHVDELKEKENENSVNQLDQLIDQLEKVIAALRDIRAARRAHQAKG